MDKISDCIADLHSIATTLDRIKTYRLLLGEEKVKELLPENWELNTAHMVDTLSNQVNIILTVLIQEFD